MWVLFRQIKLYLFLNHKHLSIDDEVQKYLRKKVQTYIIGMLLYIKECYLKIKQIWLSSEKYVHFCIAYLSFKMNRV